VLTNVWNFMDGIDGLAASQAVLVATGLVLWLAGPWAALALALMAACLGFLPFNFPRARIFLGDVGSGAIGFAIAALAMVLLSQRGPMAAWLMLPLAPFLTDASLTLLRRILRRERWWTPHTQHAYQVCARRHGHVKVTLAYTAMAGAGIMLGWVLYPRSPIFMFCSVAAWYTSAAFLWFYLQYRPGARD
jgi:UDP-N-acetylmuramyl pentapeptide phosphotransferase/UDP-N-acetylglucosamine-1-phosphate transferase